MEVVLCVVRFRHAQCLTFNVLRPVGKVSALRNFSWTCRRVDRHRKTGLGEKLMDEIHSLAIARQNAHPTGSPRFYENPYIEHIIGMAGEFAFGKRYSLQVDKSIRPDGDGHVDFRAVMNNGKTLTFDIKTAIKAYNLLIKEWEIDDCSLVLVLAQYDPANEAVSFLGWQTKGVMRTMRKKVFSASLGIMNYYCPRNELRNMEELDQLFKTHEIRDALNELHIEPDRK